MLVESVIAFILIVAAASFVYVLGRRAAPKPAQEANAKLTYACGEKAPVQKQRITITLSRYLIYFVILDSSVLLLAFATLLSKGANLPFLFLYLGIILASNLLLLEGGKDQ
jgi:NADH:ubiquinone oxidoreductase subunit 3 (subunit A)